MLPSLATETLTIFYAKKTESRGTVDYEYQADPNFSIEISGCSVQPVTTTSTQELPRNQDLTMLWAWIPQSEWERVQNTGDIHKLLIEWNGLQLVQYGDALRWTSPTGNISHVQIYMRQYRG